MLKSTITSFCLPLAPTSPNNLPTSNNLSRLVQVALDFSSTDAWFIPTLASCASTLPRAYLHRYTRFPRSSCHNSLFETTSPLAADSQCLEGVSSSLDIYIERRPQFPPINNSALSSLPITVTFSLICRVQTKTDTILVWGNHVEVPQGIHKAMFFFRRDRVGEQCSLLFHQLFQPHVFQVRCLCSV